MTERLLDEVAASCGEARPEVDMLVATRSNDALMHTAIPGSAGPEGRWTVHGPFRAPLLAAAGAAADDEAQAGEGMADASAQ